MSDGFVLIVVVVTVQWVVLPPLPGPKVVHSIKGRINAHHLLYVHGYPHQKGCCFISTSPQSASKFLQQKLKKKNEY